MFSEMIRLFQERSDFFLQLTLEHIAISLVAIVLAIVIGGAMGILIAEVDRMAQPTLLVVNFLYTIPSIAMFGFLLPFSGIGNTTAIIALTLYALLPMVKNTHTGLKNVDPLLIEAAVGMGSTRFQVLRRIALPLAMPVILAGIRNMTTMTIALAGIASFIGAGGLGIAIYRGITTNNAALAFDGSLLIACLALLADTVLARLEKRVFFRRSGTRGRRRRSWRRLAAISLALVAAGGAYAFFQSTKVAVIRIATKPMTEQLILGEMLKLVIEQDSGLKVALTPGVGGGTSNIMPAMENGDFDIYPEYTGTGWLQVLKRTDAYDESRFAELQEEYRNRYHMEWLGMTGFNDTFGIAVRRDLAERYQLRTYSDLARVADKMNFGAEYDFFEREDGFPAMCRAYGMNFASTVDIDIGLKYQALDEGKLDSMIVFTTDGRLSKVNGIVLEDDKKFFTSYECGMVVREAALVEHPELRDLLAHFDGLISEAEMAEMNDAVESGGEEPRTVARRFLEEKGVLR